MIRAPVYELRPGSALANWLAFVLLGRPTAVITVGARAYEIYRLTPQLAKGNINLHPLKTMKKRSTQVSDWLKTLQEGPDGNVSGSIPFAKITWCIKTLKRIDARDEQGQKPRRKPKKHAPTKGAKKSTKAHR